MLKGSGGAIVSTGELSAINADGSGGTVEIENGAGGDQGWRPIERFWPERSRWCRSGSPERA